MDTVRGVVSGTVVKGPVAGAQVTVYALEDGDGWDHPRGHAETGDDGSFTVEVGLAHGHLLLEVTGGHYTEEATGARVGLGDRRLFAWLPDFDIGERRSGVQVNPVTTWIVAYSRWRMTALGEDAATAESHAADLFNAHFGDVDWRTTRPIDPTTHTDAAYDDAAVAGLLLGGLSQLPQEMAAATGDGGLAFNTAALVALVAEDLEADGRLDGLGPDGTPLTLHGHPLSVETLRQDLARAVLRFIDSPRHVSGLSAVDLSRELQAMASSDAAIFDEAPASPLPEIVLETPLPGARIEGEVPIRVIALDPIGTIEAFDFVAPAYLQATPAAGLHTATARLEALLDADRHDEGPVEIVVRVRGRLGLERTETFEVRVGDDPGGAEGPSITWIGPAFGHEAGPEDVVVEVTASAPAGLDRFVLLDDGLALSDSDVSVGRILTIVPSTVPPNAEGYGIRITVEARDALGNIRRSSRWFTRRPPAIEIEAVMQNGEPVPDGGSVDGPFHVYARAEAGFATESLALVAPAGGDVGTVGPDLDPDPHRLEVRIDPGGGRLPAGPLLLQVRHRSIEGRFSDDARVIVVESAQ